MNLAARGDRNQWLCDLGAGYEEGRERIVLLGLTIHRLAPSRGGRGVGGGHPDQM